MSTSQDDDLLSILLVSLRNTASTFGESSPAYESIRASVEQHVQAMKAKGQTTNVTQTRTPSQDTGLEASVAAMSFGDIAYKPRPQ